MTISRKNIGPVMLDVVGLKLEAEEVDLLQHPSAGGVILFARNFISTEQVQALIKDIRRVNDELLIAVDQEGGRVQRFRDGVSILPAMGKIGELYQRDRALALNIAEQCAWLMAMEMMSLGVDLSFAPVLDLDYQRSEVIGDRSFSNNPETVGLIGAAFIRGMEKAGMASTGKHFPGHGYVVADSHTDIPRDERSYADIETQDMRPFKQLFELGLSAIMPAHIIYSHCDNKPAGFSSFWLQSVLRQKMQFDGVIFSDDLTMEGATVAGDFQQRACAAMNAGCDMVLVCNNRQGAESVLAATLPFTERSRQRLLQLSVRNRHPVQVPDWEVFQHSDARREARQAISKALNLEV